MENLDWRQGLKPETVPVFETVSQMEVVKGLYLCGGTAQSLQMMHRKSEDLDFEFVAYAGRFSRHEIHSKTIYGILLNDNYFRKPDDFSLLDPKYDVTSSDIAAFVKQYISEKNIKIKR